MGGTNCWLLSSQGPEFRNRISSARYQRTDKILISGTQPQALGLASVCSAFRREAEQWLGAQYAIWRGGKGSWWKPVQYAAFPWKTQDRPEVPKCMWGSEKPESPFTTFGFLVPGLRCTGTLSSTNFAFVFLYVYLCGVCTSANMLTCKRV